MLRECKTIKDVFNWLREDIHRTSSTIKFKDGNYRFANNQQIRGANLLMDILKKDIEGEEIADTNNKEDS